MTDDMGLEWPDDLREHIYHPAHRRCFKEFWRD
jgi:hypothetical protein